MNLAPVLDLQILPLNGDDDLDEPEPGDEIAYCDAPRGRAGNDAGAPQGWHVPGPTAVATDTVTINRLASPASQPDPVTRAAR
jgi:hypothetical protein